MKDGQLKPRVMMAMFTAVLALTPAARADPPGVSLDLTDPNPSFEYCAAKASQLPQPMDALICPYLEAGGGCAGAYYEGEVETSAFFYASSGLDLEGASAEGGWGASIRAKLSRDWTHITCSGPFVFEAFGYGGLGLRQVSLASSEAQVAVADPLPDEHRATPPLQAASAQGCVYVGQVGFCAVHRGGDYSIDATLPGKWSGPITVCATGEVYNDLFPSLSLLDAVVNRTFGALACDDVPMAGVSENGFASEVLAGGLDYVDSGVGVGYPTGVTPAGETPDVAGDRLPGRLPRNVTVDVDEGGGWEHIRRGTSLDHD